MGYGMQGAIKLREKRNQEYQRVTSILLDMPKARAGQHFYRVDAEAWGAEHGIGPSTVAHMLQDMVEYNVLMARASDIQNTLIYRVIPKTEWTPIPNDIPLGRYYGQVE